MKTASGKRLQKPWVNISHTVHVRYIYLHYPTFTVVDFDGKCRNQLNIPYVDAQGIKDQTM